jgi:hypothetical protein
MCERIAEQVETQAQEERRKEANQTSESSSEPAANDQGLGVVRGDASDCFCAHGSTLAGAASRGDRILDAQKLEIGETRGAPQTQRGLPPSI